MRVFSTSLEGVQSREKNIFRKKGSKRGIPLEVEKKFFPEF
jgi:hypothetical protein